MYLNDPGRAASSSARSRAPTAAKAPGPSLVSASLLSVLLSDREPSSGASSKSDADPDADPHSPSSSVRGDTPPPAPAPCGSVSRARRSRRWRRLCPSGRRRRRRGALPPLDRTPLVVGVVALALVGLGSAALQLRPVLGGCSGSGGTDGSEGGGGGCRPLLLCCPLPRQLRRLPLVQLPPCFWLAIASRPCYCPCRPGRRRQRPA